MKRKQSLQDAVSNGSADDITDQETNKRRRKEEAVISQIKKLKLEKLNSFLRTRLGEKDTDSTITKSSLAGTSKTLKLKKWCAGVFKQLTAFSWNEDSKEQTYLLALFRSLGRDSENEKARLFESKLVELSQQHSSKGKQNIAGSLIQVALRLRNFLAARISIAVLSFCILDDQFDTETFYIGIGYVAAQESSRRPITNHTTANGQSIQNSQVEADSDFLKIVVLLIDQVGTEYRHHATEAFILGCCAGFGENSPGKHWRSIFVNIVIFCLIWCSANFSKSEASDENDIQLYAFFSTCIEHVVKVLLPENSTQDSHEYKSEQENAGEALRLLFAFPVDQQMWNLLLQVGLSQDRLTEVSSIVTNSMPVSWTVVRRILNSVPSQDCKINTNTDASLKPSLLLPEDALWALEILLYRAAKFKYQNRHHSTANGTTFDPIYFEQDDANPTMEQMERRWYGLAQSLSQPGMTNNFRRERVDWLLVLLVFVIPEIGNQIFWDSFTRVKNIIQTIITNGKKGLGVQYSNRLRLWNSDLGISAYFRRVRKPFDFALSLVPDSACGNDLFAFGIENYDWLQKIVEVDMSFIELLPHFVLAAVYLYTDEDNSNNDIVKTLKTQLGNANDAVENIIDLVLKSLKQESKKVDDSNILSLPKEKYSASRICRRLSILFHPRLWVHDYLSMQLKCIGANEGGCDGDGDDMLSALYSLYEFVNDENVCNNEKIQEEAGSGGAILDFVSYRRKDQGGEDFMQSQAQIFVLGHIFCITDSFHMNPWILYSMLDNELVSSLSNYLEDGIKVLRLCADSQGTSNVAKVFLQKTKRVFKLCESEIYLRIKSGVEIFLATLLSNVETSSVASISKSTIFDLIGQYNVFHNYSRNFSHDLGVSRRNLAFTVEMLQQNKWHNWDNLKIECLKNIIRSDDEGSELLTLSGSSRRERKSNQITLRTPSTLQFNGTESTHSSFLRLWKMIDVDVSVKDKGEKTVLREIFAEFDHRPSNMNILPSSDLSNEDILGALTTFLGTCREPDTYAFVLSFLLSCNSGTYANNLKTFPSLTLNIICLCAKCLIKEAANLVELENSEPDIFYDYDGGDCERTAVKVRVSGDISPTLSCTTKGIARIMELIHLEIVAAETPIKTSPATASHASICGLGNNIHDRIFLLSICMETNTLIQAGLEAADSLGAEELMKTLYYLYPYNCRNWLIQKCKIGKGSLNDIWKKWLFNDVERGTGERMLAFVRKKCQLNVPILKALWLIESSGGCINKMNDAVCILRVLAVRQPVFILEYVRATIMLFQGGRVTSVEGNAMENLNVAGVLGEPRVMEAIVAVWESLGDFIFTSSDFSNICILMLRVIDFTKRRKELIKYYHVSVQCIDLLYNWAKTIPSQLKQILLTYHWTKSMQGEDKATTMNIDSANAISETITALKIIEGRYQDIPKVAVLRETILHEKNMSCEANPTIEKNTLFYDNVRLGIGSNINSERDESEGMLAPIECVISDSDKLHLEKLLNNSETVLATLMELSCVCTKIPSLLSQLYETLRNIAFRTFSSGRGGEAEITAIACRLRALELLLMYLYGCKNDGHISTVFDEYVSLLSSSITPLEMKKQALTSSVRFANFAITRKDFQKLLRVVFGLSSTFACGEIFQQLTGSLRGEFKDL